MKILVKRKTFTDVSTIGELSVDGKFECYTLEDKVREEGVKIAGETAIPAGTYPVEVTFSPRFKRRLPILNGVKNFEGVRIHPGNKAADTEGCILVGKSKGQDLIFSSRDAFNALFPKIDAALKNNEPVTLEIA